MAASKQNLAICKEQMAFKLFSIYGNMMLLGAASILTSYLIKYKH